MRSSNEEESRGEKNIPIPHLNPPEKDPLMKFLSYWQADDSMTTITNYMASITDMRIFIGK